MKQILQIGAVLLAVSACAPQAPPPPPPPAAAGAEGNTTTYFDGTYEGSFAQNMSTGQPASTCPDIRVAPYLRIQNGFARFDALNLNFQGYVTTQGELRMAAPTGQTFVGQIDPYYVLRGRVSGTCVYDATWRRRGAAGKNPN